MAHGILLVDDKRDVIRLLHGALDSLKNTDLEVYEAPSGEEAMLEASRNKIELLVTDYLLPGITGVELMHKIRVGQPDVKAILVTNPTEREVRDEMLNAGAMAIFEKPIPLADFLDVVERALGLTRTIFPSEPAADARSAARYSRLSDLIANFRQDLNAQAVFLLNERGMVLARAGDFRDTSLEVSLLSALMAIHSAGLKVSRFVRQESLDAHYVFGGGDHDLIFMPVTAMYGLLVAGNELAAKDRVVDTVKAMLALRKELEKTLQSMGVTGELAGQEEAVETTSDRQLQAGSGNAKAGVSSKKKRKTQELADEESAEEMETLLKEGKKKVKVDELDSFWQQAAEKHNQPPITPDVISYKEARQMGLTPDEEK